MIDAYVFLHGAHIGKLIPSSFDGGIELFLFHYLRINLRHSYPEPVGIYSLPYNNACRGKHQNGDRRYRRNQF